MSNQKKISGPVVGIDSATTYSVIAIYRNHNVEVIANDQGNRSTPSVVSFSDTERLVGDSAKNQAPMNPVNTVYEIKRLMGRKWSDPEVQNAIKKFPFKVINKNDKPCVQVEYMGETKTFTPEEVTAMVLGDLKKTAEAYLGEKVTHAVVTVPAYFNEQQRQATKDAATIAGLNVIRLISEPTAATVAYGLDKIAGKEKTVMTIDSGGGTYDISVLNMENGVFEVKAVGGNTFLGGADFDNYMVDYCKDEFKRQHGIDITSDLKAIRRLRTACERAKRTLSNATSADIEIDSLSSGKDFMHKLSRAKFESICAPLFKKHIDLIEPVLKDAKISKSEIEEIILVGGTTRIPKLRQMISEFFGGKSLCTEVNPDEAVAVGAAIQAAALSGQKDDKLDKILVVDVTPLSLGIETVGGIMTKIINRNDTVPCTKKQTFSNYEDNQPSVNIQIFEGERASTRECNRLGNFQVSGLPPARKGTLAIEVSMTLDSDGILIVTAEEKTSKKSGNIKITNDTNRLSKADIDRMVKDAEKYKEQDDILLKKREAINKLESLINQCRDSATDTYKDKISPEDLELITRKCKDLEQWLQSHQDETVEEYEKKYQSLQDAAHTIMKKISEKSPTVEECD